LLIAIDGRGSIGDDLGVMAIVFGQTLLLTASLALLRLCSYRLVRAEMAT